MDVLELTPPPVPKRSPPLSFSEAPGSPPGLASSPASRTSRHDASPLPVAAADDGPSSLLILPDDVLIVVAEYLCAREARALASTCRACLSLASPFVVHSLAAVSWADARALARAGAPDAGALRAVRRLDLADFAPEGAGRGAASPFSSPLSSPLPSPLSSPAASPARPPPGGSPRAAAQSGGAASPRGADWLAAFAAAPAGRGAARLRALRVGALVPDALSSRLLAAASDSLTTLSLAGCAGVRDAYLDAAPPLPRLVALELSCCWRVSSAGLRRFAGRAPSVAKALLAGVWRVDDAALAALARAWPRLAALAVSLDRVAAGAPAVAGADAGGRAGAGAGAEGDGDGDGDGDGNDARAGDADGVGGGGVTPAGLARLLRGARALRALQLCDACDAFATNSGAGEGEGWRIALADAVSAAACGADKDDAVGGSGGSGGGKGGEGGEGGEGGVAGSVARGETAAAAAAAAAGPARGLSTLSLVRCAGVTRELLARLAPPRARPGRLPTLAAAGCAPALPDTRGVVAWPTVGDAAVTVEAV